MMNLRLRRTILFSIIGLAAITACDPEEVVQEPDFTISSDVANMDLQLTWDLGTTEEDALAEIDLDLELLADGLKVSESAETTSFEELSLMTDQLGTTARYVIQAFYFRGDVEVDYTLTMTLGEEVRTFNGTLTTANRSRSVRIIEFSRSTSTDADDEYSFYYPE